jgi:HEAT repeat protein
MRNATECVPTLVDHLHDREDEVRDAVASALGELGDERAVAPLAEALAGTDVEFAHIAAAALGKIGSPAAGEALAAALSRGPLADAAMAALRETPMNVKQVVLLGPLGHPSAPVRATAAALLQGATATKALQALRGALADPDARVRAAAASSFAGSAKLSKQYPILFRESASETRDAADYISALLQDSMSSVRRAAARALAQIDDDRARDALASLLDDDELGELALRGLIAQFDPRAAQRAAERLADPDSDVRREALKQLTEFLGYDHSEYLRDPEKTYGTMIDVREVIPSERLSALGYVQPDEARSRYASLARVLPLRFEWTES